MITKPDRYLGHSAPGAEVNYYHTYYATPEGKGYQQIKRELTEEFVRWLKEHKTQNKNLYGLGYYYFIPEKDIDSLLKSMPEPEKKEIPCDNLESVQEERY
jgi:hypothetical protein